MYRHLLVATDFEASALHALDLALLLAPPADARVTIVHVVAPPPSAYALYAEGLSWPTDEMDERAQEMLDEVVARARLAYPKVSGRLATGEPWEAILEAAKQESADLIVTGTHGRHGLKRLLLGSVAERVVRTAPVPVLTVPLPATAPAPAAQS